jgi:hypothetical protein|tara:strand:+ start:1146 stop:1424 length:279 start_codon:yes stop_codon:yes gene_type:complete
VETVYEKYRPAHEVLIEYYSYEDLRRILKIEWEEEDYKYKVHSDALWKEYETAARNEKRREQNSKSARIARKLEQMRLTDELVSKIKRRNGK